MELCQRGAVPAITQAHGSALVLLRRLDVVVREKGG